MLPQEFLIEVSSRREPGGHGFGPAKRVDRTLLSDKRLVCLLVNPTSPKSGETWGTQHEAVSGHSPADTWKPGPDRLVREVLPRNR
jgi:hypothetical protein